jgi:hypothetical protein
MHLEIWPMETEELHVNWFALDRVWTSVVADLTVCIANR